MNEQTSLDITRLDIFKQKSKKLKRDNEKLETKVKFLIEENRKLKQMLQEQETKKEERYLILEENKELNSKMKQKEQTIENLKGALQTLKMDNSLLVDKAKKLQSQIVMHLKKIKNQKENLAGHTLKTKGHRNQIKALDKVVKQLKNNLKRSESKQSELRRTIEDFKQQSPVHLLKFLNENLTDQNVNDYEEVFEIKKRVAAIKQQLKAFAEQSAIVAEQKEYFGTIKLENGKGYFYTLNGEEYEISGFSEKYLTNGKPAVGHREVDGTIYVNRYYTAIGPIEKPSKGKNKRKTLRQQPKKLLTYDYQHNVKVLLVGSRNKSRYTELLQQQNIDVDWFDPYEESLQVLQAKKGSFDIIILFQQHISHSVTDIINLNDDHVEMINKDNNISVSARVHFVARKLKLIW